MQVTFAEIASNDDRHLVVVSDQPSTKSKAIEHVQLFAMNDGQGSQPASHAMICT